MINNLLKQFNQRPIAYYPLYKDITGTTTAGILLSQLMYWFYKKDKIYKTDKEIIEEIHLTVDELRSAKRKIKELTFITVTKESIPCKTYYQINWNKYRENLEDKFREIPLTSCISNSEYKSEANSELQTITETTTEITSEITSNTYTDCFEEVWELYERKGSKFKASKLWKKLSVEDKIEAKEKIGLYFREKLDRKYRKDFERYLSDRIFDNEFCNSETASSINWRAKAYGS